MHRSQCPISCSLDILGDRWTLVIVRDAIFKGFTTFGEFQSSSEQISSSILASRLQKMVNHGIFIKESDPNNKLRIHYRLTKKGSDLKGALISLARWGNAHIPGVDSVSAKVRSHS